MFTVCEFFDGFPRYSRIFSSRAECLKHAERRRKNLNFNWSVYIISLSSSSVECVV